MAGSKTSRAQKRRQVASPKTAGQSVANQKPQKAARIQRTENPVIWLMTIPRMNTISISMSMILV